MTPPHLLDPPQLRALALTLAAREQERSQHWSVLAVVLGRVRDERLYAWPEYGPYPSARAWAFDVCHVPTARYRLLAERLWPLMRTQRVPIERWAGMPLTRAADLPRLVGLGADLAAWVDLALTLSTADFRRRARTQLRPDAWTTFRCRVPTSLLPTIEAALALAVPRVLGPDAPAERAADPDVRFRCVERLVVHYLQTGHLDREDEADDPA